MKINKTSTWTKKKTGIVIAATVAALACGIAAAAYYKVGPFAKNESSFNLDKPSKEQINAGNDTKKQTIDSYEEEQNANKQPTDEGQVDKTSVGMDITASNQDETHYRLRALIQTLTNSGTCTLSMKRSDGKSYTASADVQALPNNSTCKGFDVPLGELGAGQWQVALSFSNDTHQATANKTMELQ